MVGYFIRLPHKKRNTREQSAENPANPFTNR